MSPKTIVITGASDGIGAAGARELKSRGHIVVIVGRSTEKTAALGRAIGAPFHVADFADLSQVRMLGEQLRERYGDIDVLANNAGGIFGTRVRTIDGFERTLQVNYLAPFLLTHILLPRLIERRATVINTSSIAARMWGALDLDDLNHDKNFSARRAYGTSKLENILFTLELQRRFGTLGVSAVAFHPGTVATNFASESTSLIRLAFQTPLKHLAGFVRPEQGARQLIWLAETAPTQSWEPGGFYVKGKVAKTPAQAHDPVTASTLWDLSESLLGLSS
jgi:NAD(P)-dependent dehydrogenase (short-subunit alcohol dehydrogenase family)